jgi:hypothetical protein
MATLWRMSSRQTGRSVSVTRAPCSARACTHRDEFVRRILWTNLHGCTCQAAENQIKGTPVHLVSHACRCFSSDNIIHIAIEGCNASAPKAHDSDSAQAGPQLYDMPPTQRGRRQRVHNAVDQLGRRCPQTVAHSVCAPCVQRVRRHLVIATHARLTCTSVAAGSSTWTCTMLLPPHLHFEAFAGIEFVLQQAVRLQGLRQPRLQARLHLSRIDSASGLTAC